MYQLEQYPIINGAQRESLSLDIFGSEPCSNKLIEGPLTSVNEMRLMNRIHYKGLDPNPLISPHLVMGPKSET